MYVYVIWTSLRKMESYKPRNKHIMGLGLSVKLIKHTIKAKLEINLWKAIQCTKKVKVYMYKYNYHVYTRFVYWN